MNVKLVENSLKDKSLKLIFQEQWEKDLAEFGKEAYQFYLCSTFSFSKPIRAISNHSVVTSNFIARIGIPIDY